MKRLPGLLGLAILAAATGPAAAEQAPAPRASYYHQDGTVSSFDELYAASLANPGGTITVTSTPAPGGLGARSATAGSPTTTATAAASAAATTAAANVAAAAAPCALPAGPDAPADPGAPSQVGRARVPPQVLAQHLTGCATLVFHIGPDGRPTDIRVASENPTSHEIGPAVQAALAEARFAPALAGRRWYQVTQVFLPRP